MYTLEDQDQLGMIVRSALKTRLWGARVRDAEPLADLIAEAISLALLIYDRQQDVHRERGERV